MEFGTSETTRRSAYQNALQYVSDLQACLMFALMERDKDRYPEGMTCEELVKETGRDLLNVRPAITRLKTAGFLGETGITRRNKNGRPTAVVALRIRGINLIEH